MARAAFEAARSYANERVAFGTAIANHQAIQFRPGRYGNQDHRCPADGSACGNVACRWAPCLTEAAMAKLYAFGNGREVCSAAIQIHGGYGYVSDYLVEKIWRDVRVCQIYEGTSDVQRITDRSRIGLFVRARLSIVPGPGACKTHPVCE